MAAPHGASPPEGDDNYHLIDAGMHPVTLLRGAVFFHHADSFAMMRGGHLDICVLGGYHARMHATGPRTRRDRADGLEPGNPEDSSACRLPGKLL
jgi:hypothetical protein